MQKVFNIKCIKEGIKEIIEPLRINKDSYEAIKDPRNVNFIASFRTPYKYSLSGYGEIILAGLVNGELVELTKPKSVLTSPYEPMDWFAEQVGDVYMLNFECVNDGCCVSRKNFNGFKFVQSENNKKHTNILGTFKNGTSCSLYEINNGYFKADEIARLEQLQESIFNYQRRYDESNNSSENPEPFNKSTNDSLIIECGGMETFE